MCGAYTDFAGELHQAPHELPQAPLEFWELNRDRWDGGERQLAAVALLPRPCNNSLPMPRMLTQINTPSKH